jgi:hypothetical protein
MQSRLAAGILAVSFATATTASAHISLEQGGTHMSRHGDRSLKDGPCGEAGGKRGTNVYTYEPGQTISVSIVEFIPHPGYFRIAFDDDGDDGFKEPVSIKPIDPKRKCPTAPTDHCGTSDFYNSPSVLPGMDNLNPHLAKDAKASYTFEVKLPNVECNNCTLQVLQIMEDDDSHGPFDTTPGAGVADIYHQCIDLVLKRGGGGDAGPSGSSGAAPAGDSGGCNVGRRAGGLSTAAVLGLALGALWSRRRRRL